MKHDLSLTNLSFDAEISRLTRDFTGRDWLFAQVDAWLTSDDRFFVLAGEPGIGKSALAAELCRRRRTPPSAYHFCIPGHNSTIVPSRFLRSIAAQLAACLPGYGAALAATVDPVRISVEARVEIAHMTGGEVAAVVIQSLQLGDPQAELDLLLAAPLSRLDPGEQVLIVVDGLDEALTLRSTPNIVELLSGIADLPPWLRVLCTTRPDERVLRQFPRPAVRLFDSSSMANQEDLQSYISTRAAREPLADRLGRADRGHVLDRVLACSRGNFLYARVLLDDIEADGRVLDNLSALPRSLEEIYRSFFLRFPAGEWQSSYQPLLSVLSVAREPVTEDDLAHFTRFDRTRTRRLVGVIRQFLVVHDTSDGPEYTLFHASLADYLTDGARNRDFWCAPEDSHRQIATYYLEAFAAGWSSCDDYGFAQLGVHLAEAGLHAQLEQLLTTFDWPQAKISAAGVDALRADYALLAPDHEAAQWSRFLDENAHMLRRGDDYWPAGRILLQLATETEAATCVGRAARAWLPRCPWLWLRRTTEAAPVGRGCLRVYEGHEHGSVNNGVNGAHVLPGERLLSWGSDGTLRLWQLDTGKLLRVMRGHRGGGERGGVFWVERLDRDRMLSLAADDPTLCVWSSTSGELLGAHPVHTAPVSGLQIMSPTEFVTWSEPGELVLWSSDTVTPTRPMNHGDANLTGVCRIDDHRVLCWTEKPIRMVDLHSGMMSESWGRAGVLAKVQALSSGRAVMWAFDGPMRMWNTNTGRLIATLDGHTDRIWGAARLPGDRLISWSSDNTLRVWDTERAQCVQVLRGHTAAPQGATLLQDGRLLSWSDGNQLRVWDLERGVQTAALDVEVTWGAHVIGSGIQISAGRVVSWFGREIFVWDLGRGELAGVLTGHSGGVAEVISIDEGRVISWSDDNTLRLWDPAAASPRRRGRATREGCTGLADGRLLAWYSDGGVRVFAGDSPRPVLELGGHTGAALGAIEISRQRIVTWSTDRTLRVWDLRSGAQLACLEGHEGEIDGARELANDHLVSWGHDGVLRVWDLASGSSLHALVGHLGNRYAFWDHRIQDVLALDDRRIVSWSTDTTIRVWDIVDGTQLAKLAQHTDAVEHVVALPGDRLLSCSADNDLRIWHLSGKGNLLLSGHDGTVSGACVLPSGRIVSWSENAIRIWSAAGEPVAVVPVTSAGRATGASSGQTLGTVWPVSDDVLLAMSRDHRLRLWSWREPRLLSTVPVSVAHRYHPEWIRLTSRRSVVNNGHVAWGLDSQCGITSLSPDSRLRAVWHSDGDLEVLHLFSNGVIAVGFGKEEVVTLEPWLGDRPIDLSKLGALTVESLAPPVPALGEDAIDADAPDSGRQWQRIDPRPDIANSHVARGIECAQRGDFASAEGYFDDAIRIHARPDTYRLRGLVHARQGRPERACADWSSALLLDPTFALVYCLRAEAYLNCDRRAEALEDWNQAIRLDPELARERDLEARRAALFRHLGLGDR